MFTATTIVGQIQSNIVNSDTFLPEEFSIFQVIITLILFISEKTCLNCVFSGNLNSG